MTAPIARQPRIGGIAGGCGTTLVAALVGAADVGRVSVGEQVEVIVCRSISSHLTEVTQFVRQSPRPPIVVISADSTLKIPGVVRDRARILQAQVPALLWLDFIQPLRSMSDPINGARAEVLASPVSAGFGKAFAFRQELVDALISLLSAPEIDQVADPSAGYEPFRQTS